jgi:hypothetical protein
VQVHPVEAMEGRSRFADALQKIAISYAELSDSYSVEEIVEGFVSNQGWCQIIILFLSFFVSFV